MKRVALIFSILFIALCPYVSAQNTKTTTPQKIVILPDVFLMASWGDSVKVDSLYAFQLTGHTGKIANMKVVVAYGTVQQTSNNNYKVKINPNDKTLDITISKLDPMTKETKVIKHLIIPAKKH